MSTPNGYESWCVAWTITIPDHDLSQQQVADYLGMKQPQYSRYERGLRDVPTDILIKLSKLYKTSTDYILGLTNKK